MSERAEALAQLARMLGDESLRTATLPDARATLSSSFEQLADALVLEATASDDVYDRSSALSYVDKRLEFLSSVLEAPQLDGLREAVSQRVEQW